MSSLLFTRISSCNRPILKLCRTFTVSRTLASNKEGSVEPASSTLGADRKVNSVTTKGLQEHEKFYMNEMDYHIKEERKRIMARRRKNNKTGFLLLAMVVGIFLYTVRRMSQENVIKEVEAEIEASSKSRKS